MDARRTTELTMWAMVSMAAAGLAACASYGGDDGLVSCLSDVDCLQNEVCVLGACSESDALSGVHVEVDPLDDSGLLAQQYFNLETMQEERAVFRLRDTVDITGTVLDVDGSPLPGRLVAVPRDRIPGRSLLRQTLPDGTGAYALPLIEGDVYRVTFYPDDPHTPPWTESEAFVGSAFASTLNVSLPGEEGYFAITGQVAAGDGAAALPIPGLEVQLSLEGRVVSSVDRTDEDGTFVLRLPAMAAGALTLVVRPTEANPQFPVVEVDADILEPQDVGVISLGPVASPVPFTGRVLGPGGDAVAYGQIYLRGTIGNGEVLRQVTCDERGRFAGELPPGNYDVVVVSPVNETEPGMVRQSNVAVPGDGAGYVFAVEERVRLTGAVVDAVGQAVQGATVEFERIARPGDGAGPDPVLQNTTWTFATTTSSDGSYATRVDPGRYRVRIVPSPEAQLPVWTTVIDVFADSSVRQDLTLPEALLLAGQVVGPTDTAVPGATVRVYSLAIGEDGAALYLGESRADETGAFGVVLPQLGGG